VIGEVRGKGLMLATEFTQPNGEPAAKTAKAVRQSCQENNLLLLTCGPYSNVIRWIPPLLIDEGHIDEGLGVFEKALREVAVHW
jgi:4-aminobutyrate aminotransferase-like enzyme